MPKSEDGRRGAGEGGTRTALIPNLITIGNAVCGFVALTYIANVDGRGEQLAHFENLGKAAWFILLGMAFDVFDGRIARLTGTASPLGAQLDSLADLITFGIAPAGLVITLNRIVLLSEPMTRIVWIFGLAYFLGALLRLARFNVEHDEADEEHLCFKGMPTPAAAGVVVGLVIVYFWLAQWRSWELRAVTQEAPAWVDSVLQWIARTLPFVAFLSGTAMVSSRLRYPHFASVLVGRRHQFDTLAALVFGSTLALIAIEPLIGLAFLVYALWTPLRTLLGRRGGVVVAMARTGARTTGGSAGAPGDDRP